MTGSLQYPHTGEKREGEHKGMSERKECADRIKKISFMCLVFPHNLFLGCSSR